MNAISEGGVSKATADPGESALVLTLLVAFLVVNLLTALNYPHVWNDEVMYTDPAANLIQGNGFTSTAWYAQAGDRFFAGNTPLHPLLLTGWIYFFGFSPVAVRSINYFWFTLATFLVWRFCVRAGLITSARWRLILMLLLATGSGFSFSYRSGRPDMIGYFLVALSLYAVTIQRRLLRTLSLLALGMLFPWAGLQLLLLIALVTVLIFAFGGLRLSLDGVWLGIGGAFGLAGLYGFYASHGVWPDFVASVGKHIAGAAGQDRQGGWAGLFVRDHSAPFLLLLNIGCGICAYKARDAVTSQIAWFGLASGIIIPPVMQLCGVFPVYYGWMAALPQGLAICHAIARHPPRSMRMKSMVALLLAGAMVVGLPARLLVAALDSGNQPYSAVQEFVSSHLAASDNAFLDSSAYYPGMRTAQKVYTLRYLNVMPAAERANVTAMVINPDNFSSLRNEFPGNWRWTAELTNQNVSPLRLPAFMVRHFQSNLRRDLYAPYWLAVYRKLPDAPLR